MTINGFSTIKQKLTANQSCALMVWGDSTSYYKTGEGLNCWPYLLAARLAAAYPAFTVRIKRFNVGALNWNDAWTVVQTGSGGSPPVLDIYNFSIVGIWTYFVLGSNWSYIDIPVDGLLINLGHNHFAGSAEQVRGEFFVAVEMYRARFPSTPITAIAQNPWRDSGGYTKMADAWKDVCSLRSVALCDVHQTFIDAGKPSGWYSDDVHANQTGQNNGWDATIWAHWQAATAGTQTIASSLVDVTTGKASLVPAIDSGSWVAAGTGVLTVATDITRYDPATGYSRKLTATGNETWLEYILPAETLTKVRGQLVTFSARSYIESGTNSTLRLCAINVDGTEIFSRPYNRGWDGWAWWSLSGVAVPSNASVVKLKLYHDMTSLTGGGAPQAKPVNYDQASLLIGKAPYAGRELDKLTTISTNAF